MWVNCSFGTIWEFLPSGTCGEPENPVVPLLKFLNLRQFFLGGGVCFFMSFYLNFLKLSELQQDSGQYFIWSGKCSALLFLETPPVLEGWSKAGTGSVQ